MTIVYSRHRFPPDVIQHSVWLYARFALSYRDVEDLLAERGIEVSYESIRCCVAKFGPLYARRIRCSRPTPNTRWHLDEMFVSMRGGRVYLWRAVDNEGEVLEALVQRKRDAKAALRLIRILLRKQGYCPSAVVTDRLRSYHSALRSLGLNRLHDTGRWTNNRAEVSHQPVRRRERQRRAFGLPASPSASSSFTPPSTTCSTSSATSSPAGSFGSFALRHSASGGCRPRSRPEVLFAIGADHDFLAAGGSRADRGSYPCGQFCRYHCGAGGGEDGARHHQWRGEQEGKRRRLGEQDEA